MSADLMHLHVYVRNICIFEKETYKFWDNPLNRISIQNNGRVMNRVPTISDIVLNIFLPFYNMYLLEATLLSFAFIK